MANWFTAQKTDYLKVPIADVVRNENLTPEEKIILIILASYDPSHPTIPQICRQSGLGRTAVIEKIKLLKEQNVIQRLRGNSHGTASENTINHSSQWKLKPLPEKNKRKGSQIGNRARKSATQTNSSPQLTTPKESINNNINRTGADSVLTPSAPTPNDVIHGQLNENKSNQPEVRNMNQPAVSYEAALSELMPLRDDCQNLYRRIQAGEVHLVQEYEVLRQSLVLKSDQLQHLRPQWHPGLRLRIPPSILTHNQEAEYALK